MQALFEFVLGLLAVIATAVLSQFGLDAEPPRHEQREVHRTHDCDSSQAAAISTANRNC